jgi:Ser/Thr protein kinase RdoA (MazF antagonist)
VLQKLLENKYGIQVDEYVKLDSYDALRSNGWLYLVAKSDGREAEDIDELEKIAEHLRKNGDPHVPAFLPSNEGGFITTWEDQTGKSKIRKKIS